VNLPARIPKKAKRASRWRSQAHTKFVSGFACSNCGFIPEMGQNQPAHVRKGSHTGMGQKPDDWRVVSLCGPHGINEGCHAMQHRLGEETFWRGRDVEALIASFCRASPRRHEIERVMKEREE
jgi:hypothetical protein